MGKLMEAWSRGETTLGVWCTLPGSVQAEMIARAGVDYVGVDYQHGLIGHADGVRMMQGICAGGSAPIARAGWNEPARIMQVLDAGAEAVVVPMVNSGEEAARAVSFSKYPPLGERSYGPVRSRMVLGTGDPRVLDDIGVIVMIETERGVERAESIIATEGITGVYIGPSDLALGLGCAPGVFPHEEKLVEFLRFVVMKCRVEGRLAGIQAANGKIASYYRDLGFTMITVASDSTLLGRAVRLELDAVGESSGDVNESATNY